MRMRIERTCPCCHKVQTLEVNEIEYLAWAAGTNIQLAMPNLNDSQRELLISGICSNCWDTIFHPEESEDILEESEYNDLGIDTRTGEPFPTPS